MNEKVVGLNGKPIFGDRVNPQIVHILEGALERAKAGELCGAAIILVDREGGVYTKADYTSSRHIMVAATVYLQHDLSNDDDDTDSDTAA